MADFEEAGDDDVFRKVRKDFDAKGVAQSDQEIRTHDRPDGAGDRPDQGRHIVPIGLPIIAALPTRRLNFPLVSG